jgi:hypothetical protein
MRRTAWWGSGVVMAAPGSCASSASRCASGSSRADGVRQYGAIGILGQTVGTLGIGVMGALGPSALGVSRGGSVCIGRPVRLVPG